MSIYYQVLFDILRSKGESYEEIHPEISDAKTFSISTLSHSAKSQVWWKQNGNKRDNDVLIMPFARGKAMHEFIQARLRPMGYVTEYPLYWESGTYNLIGHVDAIDFKNKIVLEFKTTMQKYVERARLNEFILQCGAYCKVLEIDTGVPFNGKILIVKSSLFEYEVTQEDKDKGWKLINERAKQAYEELFP